VELWLVRDVPAWLVGLALIVGLPALILGIDKLVHRKLTHERLRGHNDVTGVIVATVGVAYAIIVGLCVVSLWDGYKEAQDTVRTEAVSLTPLAAGSAVFGSDVQGLVIAQIVAYEQDIVDDWDAHIGAAPDSKRIAELDRLTDVIANLKPETEAQRAFIQDALRTIGAAEQYRQRAKTEGDERQMSSVMWLGVLAATAALLFLCPFFGLEDAVVRRILLGLAAGVIATNLFLVIEMNFPYYGAFSVDPDAYRTVITTLRSGH
jgi:hypothetical protein